MIPLADSLPRWRTGPTLDDVRAAANDMTTDTIRIAPRGNRGAKIDLELRREVRGVPAGPVAQIYLNDYAERGDNPQRIALAEFLAKALAHWAAGGD